MCTVAILEFTAEVWIELVQALQLFHLKTVEYSNIEQAYHNSEKITWPGSNVLLLATVPTY